MNERVESKPAARGGIVSDVLSGFATGLLSIPEGMAYAKLAGVNPVYGLYSGIVPTLVASMTTGTILLISTLTSAIALSTASVIQVAGIQDSQMPAAIFTLTFLVGVTMLIMGLLRLGSLVSFVSNGVMTGFISAAALLIIISELGDFTGYEPVGANKVAEVLNWITNIDQWQLATTLVGVATVALLIILKRIKRTEKMATLITLLIMTLVVYFLNLTAVETVGDIATIPNSLPRPLLPDFSAIPQLAVGALSIALLALVEGAGISTAYPNPDGSRSNISRDFVGAGLGNLAGSFFQSLSTGGSLSRTGISAGAGARSRLGGVFAALWLAVTVLLFGGLAELIPLPVIGGLLFVIGGELILERMPDARLIWNTSWQSTAAALVTFVSALFIPLQYTIFLGAGLSLLLYLYQSSKAAVVTSLVLGENDNWKKQPVPEKYAPNEATVINFASHDFFAEIPTIDQRIPRAESAQNSVAIWRVNSAIHPSSTVLKWLGDYARDLKATGSTLMLADVHPESLTVLEKTGLLDLLGRENIFMTEEYIEGSLNSAWAAAQAVLAARAAPAEKS